MIVLLCPLCAAVYLSPVLHGVLFIDFVVPLLEHPVHALIHPFLVLLVVCDFILLCPLTEDKSNHKTNQYCKFN